MARRSKRGALCAELQRVLDSELPRGNRLASPPAVTDWPQPGSVFAALEQELACRSTLPPQVEHAICSDPHYGWHDECYCPLHGHLLVAGQTRPR
ncbi:hypothetical protein [Chitinolyticbacter meiyuanensis]|uniref:hypothetical protein n=1 Tax=Chitinolyticbacter meiyuanensis TaxID=682798 RepID=UPI0011E5C938|nr:hypothetical protein [Chitinolyticbacter meiyuanensis]